MCERIWFLFTPSKASVSSSLLTHCFLFQIRASPCVIFEFQISTHLIGLPATVLWESSSVICDENVAGTQCKWKWKSVFQLYLNLHSQCLGKFQCVMKTRWCESFLNIQCFSNTRTTWVVGTWTEFESVTLSTCSLTVSVTLTPPVSSSVWSDSSLVIPASGSSSCEQFGFLDQERAHCVKTTGALERRHTTCHQDSSLKYI